MWVVVHKSHVHKYWSRIPRWKASDCIQAVRMRNERSEQTRLKIGCRYTHSARLPHDTVQTDAIRNPMKNSSQYNNCSSVLELAIHTSRRTSWFQPIMTYMRPLQEISRLHISFILCCTFLSYSQRKILFQWCLKEASATKLSLTVHNQPDTQRWYRVSCQVDTWMFNENCSLASLPSHPYSYSRYLFFGVSMHWQS